jgi:uroporphyrinogen decarboxylase
LPRRFGVDGIILFYDITTLPVAMGLPFVLRPAVGPVPDHPIRTMADVERLEAEPDPDRFGHIRQLLQRVRAELQGELPVIVFAGAPFTVATYCIGTGKDLEATRRFAQEQPAVWQALLERLAEATELFLGTLVEDGADICQLFDSWAGMLTAVEYLKWAQPFHERIVGAVKKVPQILFVKECPYLSLMASSGADVISLGTSHDLAAARRDFPRLVFQGNVDEAILRNGTPEEAVNSVKACLRAGGGHKHILNLNHGVDRSTPVANFQAYVNTAKAL